MTNERINITAGFSISDVTKALEYGEVEVVVSNSAVDRHGESIVMEGIDLSQIKRNPVLLWGHDYSGLPIGGITKLWKSTGNLMARIKFATGIYDFADTVYKMVQNGFVNAVSIGGIVKKWNTDMTVIEKMEMVELSVVPVGAHPDALITAKSFGVEPETYIKQYEAFVEGAVEERMKGLGQEKTSKYIETLEDILKTLKGTSEPKEPKEVGRTTYKVIVK